MPRTSIQRRLIATVLLSQLLLAAGLVSTGVLYTQRRLLATLDAGLQSRAMSVAALVRYTEDASGNVYFDNSLMPASLDPGHPDLFAVWTERSGLLVQSANWPAGLALNPADSSRHWDFVSNQLPYRALRVSQVPVLDREEGKAFQPQTLTIVYAAPMLQTQTRGFPRWLVRTLCSAHHLAGFYKEWVWGMEARDPLRVPFEVARGQS